MSVTQSHSKMVRGVPWDIRVVKPCPWGYHYPISVHVFVRVCVCVCVCVMGGGGGGGGGGGVLQRRLGFGAASE